MIQSWSFFHLCLVFFGVPRGTNIFGHPNVEKHPSGHRFPVKRASQAPKPGQPQLANFQGLVNHLEAKCAAWSAWKHPRSSTMFNASLLFLNVIHFDCGSNPEHCQRLVHALRSGDPEVFLVAEKRTCCQNRGSYEKLRNSSSVCCLLQHSHICWLKWH